jgi:hypothetical protein
MARLLAVAVAALVLASCRTTPQQMNDADISRAARQENPPYLTASL